MVGFFLFFDFFLVNLFLFRFYFVLFFVFCLSLFDIWKKVVGDLINYIWFVELDQDLILNLDKLHGSLIRVVRLIKAMIGPFKTLIK